MNLYEDVFFYTLLHLQFLCYTKKCMKASAVWLMSATYLSKDAGRFIIEMMSLMGLSTMFMTNFDLFLA